MLILKNYNTNNMKKKMSYTLLIILTALLITNPSYEDFKNSGHKSEAIKERDLFILSIYSCRVDYNDRMIYIGILKNFIELESQYAPIDKQIKEWEP
jgi:hypothetical protein